METHVAAKGKRNSPLKQGLLRAVLLSAASGLVMEMVNAIPGLVHYLHDSLPIVGAAGAVTFVVRFGEAIVDQIRSSLFPK